jgi:hypothetical protein
MTKRPVGSDNTLLLAYYMCRKRFPSAEVDRNRFFCILLQGGSLIERPRRVASILRMLSSPDLATLIISRKDYPQNGDHVLYPSRT